MATRMQKIRECDSTLCRRRKLVRHVKITVQLEGESGPTVFEGDLCPIHVSQAILQNEKRFKNTKQYDEPEVYNGPEERFSE